MNPSRQPGEPPLIEESAITAKYPELRDATVPNDQIATIAHIDAAMGIAEEHITSLEQNPPQDPTRYLAHIELALASAVTNIQKLLAACPDNPVIQQFCENIGELGRQLQTRAEVIRDSFSHPPQLA